MAANSEKRRYSFEQYITWLHNNGSSANHAAISANMWRALDDALGEDVMCRY